MIDTRSDFWSIVAPDPNFVPGDEHVTTDAVPSTPTGRTGPPPRAFSMHRCPQCQAFFSSEGAGEQTEDLNRRIQQSAEALRETAKLEAPLDGELKLVFKLLDGSTKLSDTKMEKFRNILERNPHFLRLRSYRLPKYENGLTLLMAAAKSNRLDETKFMLDLGDADKMLLDVNADGDTAEHIAVANDSIEVLNELISRREQIFGFKSPPPINLGDQTPYAISATQVGLRRRPESKQRTFSVNDPSVLGSPTPAKTRTRTVDHLSYGVAELPGARTKMEDSTCCNVDHATCAFVVADGHDDSRAISKLVAEELAKQLPLSENIQQTFLATDQLIASHKPRLKGGSTAIAALVSKEKVIVANVGDCRCILIQKDKMMLLSEDHRPSLPGETTRVETAGLSVVEESFQENGEIVTIHQVELPDGTRLGMSRSFGDFEFKANEALEAKDQAVTADPDIVIHERSEADLYLVLACDGIWDYMTNDEVADFVRKGLSMNDAYPSKVGDDLLRECLARDSKDNMSIIIVDLTKCLLPSPQDLATRKNLFEDN